MFPHLIELTDCVTSEQNREINFGMYICEQKSILRILVRDYVTQYT